MPKVKDIARYKREFVKTVDIYLAEKAKNNKKYRDNKIKKVELPGIEDLALYIGVTKRSIYNWEKENPKFRKALDKVRLVAKTMLINEGLAGNYSPVIAKLILGNNYGMFENQNVRVDAKIETTFTDEQVNRIADRVSGRKREVSNTPSKE